MLAGFDGPTLSAKLLLETLDGGWYDALPFRYHSGWLVAAEISRWFPFGTQRQSLHVAVRDDGYVFTRSQARQIAQMDMCHPQQVTQMPPEALEALIDREHVRMLADTDKLARGILLENDEAVAFQIAELETKVMALADKFAGIIQRYRQRLSQGDLSDERHASLAKTLNELEAGEADLPKTMRSKIGHIRTKADTVEEGILEAMDDVGDVTIRSIVHWQAVHPRRRPVHLLCPSGTAQHFTVDAWRVRLEGRSFDHLARVIERFENE
jgi:hypothetical protein